MASVLELDAPSLPPEANPPSSPLPTEPTIASATTADQLVTRFKQLAVHPVHRPKDLLVKARQRRSSPSISTDPGESVWTKPVAKAFGSALKAAKHLASVQPRFVEALHPRWNRWRCACILVEKNDMDDYSGVTKRVDSSGVGGNGSAAIEWPWSSFLVGTSLRPATAAEAQE